MTPFGKWLAEIGLGSYDVVFASNKIDDRTNDLQSRPHRPLGVFFKRASSTEDLSVRIGIATGPVVVGEAAGTGDQSKLAVGSTPNLAARL